MTVGVVSREEQPAPMITKDVKDVREPTECWSRTSRGMPRISCVCVGGERRRRGLVFVELSCCPHSSCSFIPENMAKEEVAKPVVGNDSGPCGASFAGDVPRMFSLIKNEGDPRH